MALVKEDCCEESHKYMGFALHQVYTSTASIITPKVCYFFLELQCLIYMDCRLSLLEKLLKFPWGNFASSQFVFLSIIIN